VSNGRPAFAFFNPVFRIVALDGDVAHLSRLAAELRAQYPNLRVQLVNGGR
jgi:DNA-binding transcriptional LysR family regulator